MPYQSPQKAYSLARGIILDQYDALERGVGHPARLQGTISAGGGHGCDGCVAVGGVTSPIFFIPTQTYIYKTILISQILRARKEGHFDCLYSVFYGSSSDRENYSNPKVLLCTKIYREASWLKITYENHINGEQIKYLGRTPVGSPTFCPNPGYVILLFYLLVGQTLGSKQQPYILPSGQLAKT